MAKVHVLYIFVLLLFGNFECEIYQDRPKIKTADGDLILEPAFDKSIYLRPNGPKSTIYVGDVNILDAKSKSSVVEYQEVPRNDIQDLLNGPNGILKRLEKLENKGTRLPDDLFLNISTIWRRVNNLHRKVNNLQSLINNRAKDECDSQPCQHGGTCLNLVNGYHCLCPNNWEGRDCDVDVNECRNFAGTDLGCQNGATCLNKPGYYECLCRSGWFGLHCTRKAKDCSGGDFEMCGHGTCIKTDTGEGVTCICHQGWTTNGTGVACLTDVNECDSLQGAKCSINPKVECINLPGSFRCGQCPQGYEGDGYTCADIDECITLPNGGCSPMVSCHNTIGSRICGPCPSGYQGDGVTCSWKGSCQINRGGCHPSAQCVESLSMGRTVQCICPEGMNGDGIGINGCYISAGNYSASCDSNPCGTHGQCHIVQSGYTCICRRGYGGPHCDIPVNLCAINPCRNGGICRQDDTTAAGFRCECPAQYRGSLCEVLSKTCGGVLDNEEGNIVYPLTNSTYIHNARCAWVIHTIPSKVINVTFSKFALEEGHGQGNTDCPYDFLQIHDGPSSASQLIGRFCGNVLPKGGNIISNHNNLYFWFRSDNSVAKEGFALHWTSIDPVCGGFVDANTHGHISSPGSPGKYPPNRDCYWTLRVQPGKKIQLHFFALDIETHSNCSFDYLAIYEGSRETDPLLNKYCSSELPAPVLSAGSDILVHFHSDAYGSGNGFQLTYAPAPGVPGCGGYYTSDRGEISAPTYNGTYISNIICEYKIKTSQGTKIRIDFKQFHLEKSNRCRFDYLKIYDGPSEDSPLVGKFCGTTYPKFYVATSNTLFMRFRSDVTVSGDGFKIAYEALCQFVLYGDSGVIKSPGYPFRYPENKMCEYFIGTSPGKVIKLTFQDFDIEDNRYFDCQYDNVEIRDGTDSNSTLLGKYCGGIEHMPPEQISTHNHMYVRFQSDMSLTGNGFYANYTTIAAECGGIYKETTGLINHPSGDVTTYKNDQLCTWILMAEPGMRIKLTWHRFEIEQMTSCESDYLEIIEIDEHNSNFTLGKFCGTKTPPAYTTSTNRLMLKFKSDSSVRSAGFSVSYTFLDEKSHCGGFLYRTHGFIYSPGWPQRYEPNRDCTWVITVPVGQQIKLNITQFDLERPIRGSCNHGDYLEIHNGATQNSPAIGKYCGKFQSRIITSLANSVYINFHSDYYLTGNGFKIEWDGTVTGCGGTLTSSTGSISSPNYPDSYNENAECFYKIVTSFGSRIRLSFIDLELERTSDCRDDYVEIFDGKNFDAPSLGRHCVMSTALNHIETTSNFAIIKFRSDSYISAKGFLLNYFTVCNNNLTGSYGVIQSPDYPGSYPLNLDCMWTIHVPKGNRINVTFTHFDIFSHHFAPYGRARYSSNVFNINRFSLPKVCFADYLQWKEISETKFSDKYCGLNPPAIHSIGNSIQIKFVTGTFGSKPGFSLEWKSYGCGGHVQKRYGTISIDRNIIFSDELECEWLIETDIGYSVSLNINDIFLKETQDCSLDSIDIYNGQDSRSPLLTRICNRQVSSVESTSNFMLVRLNKTSSLRGAYFTASFTSHKSKCGGNIKSLSGYIYSKNYPHNYDNNLDCKWLVSVPSNHRIEVDFMDFDLYSSRRTDCGDYVALFDNENLVTTNYTTIFCPQTNVKQFTSKYDRMILQFISNAEGNAKGFKANFTAACGAFINATSDGIITNENFMGGANKSCKWVIRAPEPDQKISLTITHLYLPTYTEVNSNKSCGSSFLRVYDGDDIDAPTIDEYCGKKAPPMIVSHGSAITVLLDSYSNHTTGHFSAHYSPLSESCGGHFTSEEGTIASPNYPLSYPISSNCEWTLSTSPGNKVYVVFEKFDLEYSEECNEDYLELRENNGAGKLLGVYCGSEIPTNTSTANKLYIKFHSSDENNGKGFLMHYGFLHGNELINMDSGEISSPLYPHLYLGFSCYSWRIQSNGTESIIITIDKLEIPSYGKSCSNHLSIYDGYDDTAPLLTRVCGKLLEPVQVVQTSSNMAFIKLSLDESNSGTLFHLSWAKQNVDSNTQSSNDQEVINCGSNNTEVVLAGNYSTFKSPNYPEDYNNDLTCQWTFKATSGRHLKLSFTEFDIEETNGCFADYISIFSADIFGQWRPIKESVCETQSAMLETNSSKYLKVKFKTDSSVTRRGFQGTVSSVCGGLITELSGEVGPTWDDTHAGSKRNFKMNCEWVIKVRPGRQIELEFKEFNISSDDCFTSVTLRNGDSKDAPLLSSGKLCHSPQNNEKLTTSSNSLYISYSNDLTRYHFKIFQTFKLRYEEKNIECGATSKLDADQPFEVITSPNYPDTPVPFSECVWKFMAPPGEILRVDFFDRFDLDNVDGCVNEFVELYDGSSILAPSLGRFCGETPSTIKTKSNALFVKYLTQISEPRNGFKANVSIDVCGGTIIAENGEIKSPGYPHMISVPPNTVCEWHIKGQPTLIYSITPQDIDLPESETPCAIKITVEEKLSGPNAAAVLKEFCDTDASSNPIASSTNEVVIKFYSGKPSEWQRGTPHRGFRFTFASDRPTCGGPVRTPEGFITTPSYPLETVNRYCSWNIIVPDPTRRIRLELIDSDDDKHTIGIYNDRIYQSLIQSIPGDGYNPTMRVYESSGNKLSIFLWLNPLKTKHKFKAKFSSDEAALCGGNLYGAVGSLTSPNLNRSYSCEWHYDNRVDNDNIEYNTILVTASVNSSVARSRCRYSDPKLNIKAIVSNIGLSFYRDLCGISQTTVRIPATVMDVKAIKSRSNSFSFELTYKSQPCGGIINIGEKPVNIVEIPSTLNDTLDCAWMILTPYNSRLELKMDGSFQYDCDNEFLKVSQGLSQYGPAIGDYCKGKVLEQPLTISFRMIYVEYHTKATNTTQLKLVARLVNNLCGGQLTTFQNEFSSPNYPKHYESNQECAWFITSELGSRVSLRFVDRFVIESSPNCTKDAVIIYDWKDDYYTENARLCGREIMGPYNSTFNKMKVVLRTDSKTNLDGFKAIWTPICGGNYLATNKTQILYSQGFPYGYPRGADCKYEIEAPEKKKILLKFMEFELEGTSPTCEYDNVTIIGKDEDGYEYSMNIYCGTDLPSTLTKYNKITLILKSDRYVQKKGFQLSYEIYDCGGQVKEPTVITSHYGDGEYDDDMNCTWLIEAPSNKQVVFKFIFIDLENNNECYMDYVAIYEGHIIEDDKRLALLCGHEMNSTIALRSRGNKALLNFETDHSYTFKGFKVAVSFTYGESVGCGGNIDLKTTSLRKLKSPLIGTNTVYENYLDCHWQITSPPDTIIKISFLSFHVASCFNVNQTALGYSNCSCDFVELRDGLNPDSVLIDKYCGHTLPPSLHSSDNAMSLRLSTDGELASSGFEVNLSYEQSMCGKTRYTISETITKIVSPGYDSGTVARGIRCIYKFESSPDNYNPVHISIVDLDLQPPYDQNGIKKCNNDKFTIATHATARNVSVGKDYIINHAVDSFISSNYYYELENSNLPQRLEYCGSVQRTDVYVSGNIAITLQTSPESDSKMHKGVAFEVSYVGFCGHNYTGTQGKIHSVYQINYDRFEDNSDVKDCYTLITAPANHTISLYFIYVSTSYWDNDVCLDILDGRDSTANRLTKIDKDYENPMPVFSTGRYILLHNHAVGNEEVQFEMVYMSTDQGRGCGGKLTSVMGRVTSPLYPDIYRRQSKCQWELETPIGTNLKLHFDVFDLGRSCDQNYVQLVDSKGNTISTYCSEKPADYTSPDNFVKIVFHTTMNNGGQGWTADFVGVV